MVHIADDARRGIDLLARHGRTRREVAELIGAAQRVARDHPGWQPLAEKSALWQAQDRLAAAQRNAGTTSGGALALLISALTDPAQRDEARRALADYFYARFVQAERARDVETQEHFRALAEAFHDGRYERELDGAGVLSLESDPAGAQVSLYRYVERGFVLVEQHHTDLGRTPVDGVTVPMGSYLAVLRLAGHADVRYPIHVERGGEWEGTVRLPAAGEIGPGFRYVPAGPYLQGGDPETRGWALPPDRPVIEDFCLAEHPVLTAEYVEFLDDIAATDPEAAQRRAPRLYPDRGYYFTTGADGRFSPPPAGADGQVWDARLPVVGISWHDANAYAGWRSARDGRRYRLPSEQEWEKAARGVDGRWFPWGNRFDPSLCNMRDSREQGPGPATVDEFPTDVTVYGVRGMAGNVRDWTSTVIGEDPGVPGPPEAGDPKWHQAHGGRVLRGGAWSPLIPRLADRYWVHPALVLSFVGFRLAYSPSP